MYLYGIQIHRLYQNFIILITLFVTTPCAKGDVITLFHTNTSENFEKSISDMMDFCFDEVRQSTHKTLFKDRIFSPDHKKCTQAKMNTMSHQEVWENCPGIPEIFFSRNSWFSSSLRRPRPVTLEISGIKFESLNLEKHSISCDVTSCKASVILKQFSMQGSVKVYEYHKQNSIILNLPDVVISSMSSYDDLYPILHIEMKNNSQRVVSDERVSWILSSESIINLPTGTIQFILPENMKHMTIKKLLSQTKVLSVRKQFFNPFITSVADRLNFPELRSLISLDRTINDHFFDREKNEIINQVLNKYQIVSSYLIDFINEKIKSYLKDRYE